MTGGTPMAGVLVGSHQFAHSGLSAEVETRRTMFMMPTSDDFGVVVAAEYAPSAI